MAFEELFLLACGMKFLRAGRADKKGAHLRDLSLREFYRVLPFSLTGAQQRAIEACTVFHSVEALQQAMNDGEDYFVIGGAAMYREFLPLADSLYLTEIDEAFDGADTFFPDWDRSAWTEQTRELHRADGQCPHTFSFVHYVRRFD